MKKFLIECVQALFMATCIGLPFALYFAFVMKPWKEIEMTATKTVNYTQEQTQQMIADYQAGVSTQQIAEALGKSVRSIVAKLSREGV